MSILLKVLLESTNATKTIKFPPDIAIAEIVRDLREKFGGGRDHGLFEPFKKKGAGGRWLNVRRTLRYYDITSGTAMIYRKKHRQLRVKLVDGSTKRVVTDVSKNVTDILEAICKKARIGNSEEYGVKIIKDEENPNAGEWLKNIEGLADQGFDEDNQMLLLAKRFFYYDANVDRSDPVQLHLIYVQARDKVIDGSYPASKEESKTLASIQLQIELGDFNPQKHRPGFMDLPKFISKKWSKNRGIEKDILGAYQKLVGMSEINAKYRYVQMVRSLSSYGITFFEVRGKPHGKDRKKKKLLPQYIGVTRENIVLADAPSREVFLDHHLTHLKRWAATSHNITLDFGNYEDEYKVLVTTEGEQIAGLISGYIDIILKARKDVATLHEEDDLNTAEIDDMRPHVGQAQMAMITGQAGTLGGAHSGSFQDQNQKHMAPSQQVKIMDLPTAQRAMKLLMDELADPSREKFHAMAEHSEMGLPQWRDQMAQNMKAVQANVGALNNALEGNVDPLMIKAALAKHSPPIGDSVRKLGQTAKMLVGKGDPRALADAVARVAAAAAGLLAAGERLQKAPHDPKTRALYDDAVRAYENAAILLDSAQAGNLSDGPAKALVHMSAAGLSSATDNLLGAAKGQMGGIKDGKTMREVGGLIKNIAAAEKAMMGTVDTLAPAAVNPKARRRIIGATEDLLGPAKALANLLPGLAELAEEMDITANQVKATVEMAEPGWTDIDLDEPHTRLIKALPMLQNARGANAIVGACKHVMAGGSTLAKAAKLLADANPNQLGGDLSKAAKLLTDGLQELLRTAKDTAANPNDPNARQRLNGKIAKVDALARQLLAVGQPLEGSALRKTGKAALTEALRLGNDMRTTARNAKTDPRVKGALLKASKGLDKALEDYMEPLKWACKEPNSPQAQNALLDASKKVVYPMSQAIAGVKRVSPQISDIKAKASLNNASTDLQDRLGNLARAIKGVAARAGDEALDEAVDQLNANGSELKAAAFAVDAGALPSLPGQSLESANLMLAQAAAELSKAIQGIVAAADSGKPLGAPVTTATSACTELCDAAKVVASTAKGKATQKGIIDNARLLNDSLAELIVAARSAARGGSKEGLARANKNLQDALNKLMAASKGLGSRDLDDAINTVNGALDRLVKDPGRRPSVASRSFKDCTGALIGSSKALNAATQQLVMTAKSNPKNAGPPAKMVASTVKNLVTVAQNAIATAPDKTVGAALKNATIDLVEQTPVLLNSVKAVALTKKSPQSIDALNGAAQLLANKLKNLVKTASQGDVMPEVEDAIQRILSRANNFDREKPGSALRPEDVLKQFKEATQELAKSATKVMSAARTESPKLGQCCNACIDSVDDILSAAAATTHATSSAQSPAVSTIIGLCDAIAGNPNKYNVVIPSTKKVALTAPQLISELKGAASRAKTKPEQQATLKLAHGLAQAISGMGKAAQKIDRDPKRTNQADVRALVTAANALKGHVRKVAEAVGGDAPEFALDDHARSKIKTTSKRVALATTSLIQTAVSNTGASAGPYNPASLNEASKMVSEAIQDMLEACKALDPAIYECDKATEKANAAIQELDKAQLLGIAKSSESPEVAQAKLVTVCKDIASGMARLMEGARGVGDLRAAAKKMGSDMPRLVQASLNAAGTISNIDMQKDLLALSRELADGLLGLINGCKEANPDDSESQRDLLGNYKSASDTLGQLVTKLRGNAIVAKELNATINSIKQLIQKAGQPGKPSGRSYPQIRLDLTKEIKNVSEGAHKVSSADKSNIGQVAMECKNLADELPRFVKVVQDAIATTKEQDAKTEFTSGLKSSLNAVLDLATTAQDLVNQPNSRQSQNKMQNAIRQIATSMTGLGKTAAKGSTGDRQIRQAQTVVKDVVGKLDSAAIYAQAGQLEPYKGSESLDDLMRQLNSSVGATVKYAKNFVAAKNTPEKLGALSASLAKAMQSQVGPLAINAAGKMGDIESQQSVLNATKQFVDLNADILQAMRDNINDPSDNLSGRTLKDANTQLDKIAAQLIESTEIALKNSNRTEKYLEDARMDIEFLLNSNTASASARPEDVMKAAKALHDSVNEMVIASNEDKIVGCSKDIFDSIKQLLAQCRGVTRLSADKMASNHLLGAGRKTGVACMEFLDKCKLERPEGNKKIEDSGQAVIGMVAGVVSTLKDMFPDHQIVDFTGGDALSIHQKADLSLQNTSKAIAEATKLLQSIKIPPRAEPKAGGGIDLHDLHEGILKASRLVAGCTGELIRAATAVQGERKSSSFSGKKYHNNPQWGKGLISAAQTVGAAINMLVSNCDLAIKKEVVEEALIATAKEVNAATAQLVASSNYRIDPNASSVKKLASAAKGVAKATTGLVNTAREAGNWLEEKQQEEQRKAFTMSKTKREQMEQRIRILQLEKQLRQERERLGNMHKSEYNN